MVTRVCYLSRREREGRWKKLAFTSEVTSQLDSRERGVASDRRNPDPFYYDGHNTVYQINGNI